MGYGLWALGGCVCAHFRHASVSHARLHAPSLRLTPPVPPPLLLLLLWQYGYESERPDAPGPDGTPGLKSPAFNYEMVDQLKVPAEKGEYLLSWRWDTEQKGQVWSGCSDIVIE